MPPPSSSKLAKCIVAPSRLASALDWKRRGSTVMALDISDQCVGVSIAEHPPSPYNNNVQKLDPIPYMIFNGQSLKNRREQKDRIHHQLSELVSKYGVAGFVVAWPLQPNGRPGGACGQVLHLLDYFADRSSSFLAKSRPCTIWDQRASFASKKEDFPPVVDKFGRDPKFCGSPLSWPLEYRSRDYMNRCSLAKKGSKPAALLLQDFMDSYWKPKGDNCQKKTSNKLGHQATADTHEDDGAYIESGLL